MPKCTDCKIQVERGTSETFKCAFSGLTGIRGRAAATASRTVRMILGAPHFYGWCYDKDGCRHCKARRQNGLGNASRYASRDCTCMHCMRARQDERDEGGLAAAHRLSASGPPTLLQFSHTSCRWRPHVLHDRVRVDPLNLHRSQPAGAGTTDKGKQPAAQKQRTRTTSQATQTKQPMLAGDAFAVALGTLPAEE